MNLGRQTERAGPALADLRRCESLALPVRPANQLGQRPPADTRTAQDGPPTSGYSATIGIVVPLATGILGRVIVRRPFLNLAATFSLSTGTGSCRLRAKTP